MTHEEAILKGFDFLPKTNVTLSLSGETVAALVNLLNKADNKDYGGFEPDYTATIMLKQQDLETTPVSYIGTEVNISGDTSTWRVTKVRSGTITSFELVSEHKA